MLYQALETGFEDQWLLGKYARFLSLTSEDRGICSKDESSLQNLNDDVAKRLIAAMDVRNASELARTVRQMKEFVAKPRQGRRIAAIESTKVQFFSDARQARQELESMYRAGGRVITESEDAKKAAQSSPPSGPSW